MLIKKEKLALAISITKWVLEKNEAGLGVWLKW
jgi:hypothetical protein